jgi:hypothetical protein
VQVWVENIRRPGCLAEVPMGPTGLCAEDVCEALHIELDSTTYLPNGIKTSDSLRYKLKAGPIMVFGVPIKDLKVPNLSALSCLMKSDSSSDRASENRQSTHCCHLLCLSQSLMCIAGRLTRREATPV